MERLGLTGAEPPTQTREQELHLTAGQVRAVVNECTEVLDVLHTALEKESDRRHELEVEVACARRYAFYDELTTLPNRSLFQQTLGAALAACSGNGIAVAYIDLDDFKTINDEHGHHIGDSVLRIVALRMTRAVRSDDMVARLGGDEFACLLAEMSGREGLSHLACKLFDSVSSPMRIGELTLTVRPSIGIAICPADGSTVENLLKSADSAMYWAKRRMAGYAFYDRPNVLRSQQISERPARFAP